MNAPHPRAQRAFTLAFTDGLTLRVTTANIHAAELIRDAGTTHDIEDRAEQLRTEIRLAGVTVAEPILELALAFHHSVREDHDTIRTVIARLRELTRTRGRRSVERSRD